jgi:hypothetical protein
VKSNFGLNNRGSMLVAVLGTIFAAGRMEGAKPASILRIRLKGAR